MILPSMPQWFCRVLCASTRPCRWQQPSDYEIALHAPVFERLEITTLVAQYTPAPMTLTPTIGMPATSIAVVAAPASTHNLYSFYSASTQAPNDLTAVEALYAFGDWAMTPMFTPFHLFLFLYVIGALWSLVFFARSAIGRQCFLEEVIRNLCYGLGTGSNILWLFMLYAANQLTADTNNSDLMETLCVHLRNLTIHTTDPGTVSALLLVIPNWWGGNHGRLGYGLGWGLWLELERALLITSRVLRDPFLKVWVKVLGITEKAAKVLVVSFIRFSIVVIKLGFIMAEIALWLVTHVYGFCFFLFSVVKGLFIRYCPEHIILKIFCFYADRDVKSHIMASNMTINERIALVHLLADTKAKSKQFNDTFVKDLGNLTIGYKQTIDKLIKEVNYFRRYLDAICNHVIEEEYNMLCWTRLVNTPGGRVRSAKFAFRDTPHPETGHYFDLALSTEEKKLYPLDKCMYFRFKPEYATNNRTKGLAFQSFAVHPERMYMKELFQRDAWGMEAKFPGVKLPDYDDRSDWDTERRVERMELASPSPLKPEDIAAQGLALEVFLKQQ